MEESVVLYSWTWSGVWRVMAVTTLALFTAAGCGDSGSTTECQENTLQICTCSDGTTGMQTCTGGAWGDCQCDACEAEVCDGVDNDCDGVVDNNIDGVGETCEVTGELGPCAVGATACTGGAIVCEQLVTAIDEECNLVDDDCDGEVDEEIAAGACNVPGVLGACAVGEQQCVNGALSCQQTVFPQTEQCNLEDTDCNGILDDGCGCTPEGATLTCGQSTGECQEGLVTCTEGEWTACDGVMPVPELCDGLDNNCDGVVDDGDPEGGSPCTVSGAQGPCATGTTTCVGGAVDCSQTVSPQSEICDGIDNDCNGQVDNGNPGGGIPCLVPGQQGECANGESACTAGSLGCLQTVSPVSEVCGDGLDNNCDGQADEPPCACTPGESQPCGTDVGACVSGWQHCNSSGTWDLTCLGNVGPGSETCNNIDDNCNGVVDENVTRSCYTGAPSTQGVGACSDGLQTCTAGSWSTDCAGEQIPSGEACNGLDDDCDGSVDETGFWVWDGLHEPNDHWEFPLLLGAIDPWTTSVSVTASFSYNTDQDYYWWHIPSYNGSPFTTVAWDCTVTGLDPGQTVHLMIGLESGVYAGTGPWDYLYLEPTAAGDGHPIWYSYTTGVAHTPFGGMIGVLMGAGFGPCTNHSYTLTCSMHY